MLDVHYSFVLHYSRTTYKFTSEKFLIQTNFFQHNELHNESMQIVIFLAKHCMFVKSPNLVLDHFEQG